MLARVEVWVGVLDEVSVLFWDRTGMQLCTACICAHAAVMHALQGCGHDAHRWVRARICGTSTTARVRVGVRIRVRIRISRALGLPYGVDMHYSYTGLAPAPRPLHQAHRTSPLCLMNPIQHALYLKQTLRPVHRHVPHVTRLLAPFTWCGL